MFNMDDSEFSKHITDLNDDKDKECSPIIGYENEPIVVLEQSLSPVLSLISNLSSLMSATSCWASDIHAAKLHQGLSLDQAMAIHLYTMKNGLYEGTTPLT